MQNDKRFLLNRQTQGDIKNHLILSEYEGVKKANFIKIWVLKQAVKRSCLIMYIM